MFDGIGMGLGFTLGLTCISIVREILGAGEIFGQPVMPSFYEPAIIFILAPGAFFVLAFLIAFQNRLRRKKPKEEKKTSASGCSCCGNMEMCIRDSCGKDRAPGNPARRGEDRESHSDAGGRGYQR